jgi:HAD superfamily hydrolase (TIGR01549 family)
MKARVIFFDIGCTLAFTGDTSVRRQIAAHLQLSEKEIKRVGRLIMTHPAECPNQLLTALSQSLPRIPKDCLHDILIELWKQQTTSVREMPGAGELLVGLKEFGLKLGVISNTWRPAYEGFRHNCPHLDDLIDLKTLSYEQGCKKPGTEIFKSALHQADCRAEDCWMIGDSFELDLEPARRLGMRSLWVLVHPERERDILAEILRGEKPGPDLAVQRLDDILPLFHQQRVL